MLRKELMLLDKNFTITPENDEVETRGLWTFATSMISRELNFFELNRFKVLKINPYNSQETKDNPKTKKAKEWISRNEKRPVISLLTHGFYYDESPKLENLTTIINDLELKDTDNILLYPHMCETSFKNLEQFHDQIKHSLPSNYMIASSPYTQMFSVVMRAAFSIRPFRFGMVSLNPKKIKKSSVLNWIEVKDGEIIDQRDVNSEASTSKGETTTDKQSQNGKEVPRPSLPNQLEAAKGQIRDSRNRSESRSRSRSPIGRRVS